MLQINVVKKIVGCAVLAGLLSFVSFWTTQAQPSFASNLVDKKGKEKKEKKEQKAEREKKENIARKVESAPSAKKPQDKTTATTRTAPTVAAAPAVTTENSKPPANTVVKIPTPTSASTVQPETTKQPPAQPITEKGVEDGSDTFRINSNLVAVPVSVTDNNGEPIRNLEVEEFKLDEEGQAQQVQSLGEPGKTPLELTLLFDVSGSVFERFDFQKQAASRFLQQVLKPSDTVSVFLVGFEGKLVIPRTRNHSKVISDLMALQPTKEGTAFHASVTRAADYLNDHAETGSRRVMVVISDGEDNFSKTISLLDAQRTLQRTDIVFYSINPSGPSIKLNRISMRGQNAMATLASETGGVAFLPDKEEELDRVFRQITAELQAQYLLGYYSTNEANDGKFRRIKIQLPKHGDLRIRARQGYYAPKE